MDGVLLRACTVGMAVHEEVLRLIMAAAGGMKDKALASLIEASLHITHKSQKHHKRRAKQIVYEYEPVQVSQRGVIAGRGGAHGGAVQLDPKLSA